MTEEERRELDQLKNEVEWLRRAVVSLLKAGEKRHQSASRRHLNQSKAEEETARLFANLAGGLTGEGQVRLS